MAWTKNGCEMPASNRVCFCSYRSDPVAAKRASGFNLFSRADGERVHAHLSDLLNAGSIRTVVGRVAPWTELPSELGRLASRATVGRTILDWHA